MLQNNIFAATQTVMLTNQPSEGKKPFRRKSSNSKEGQSKDRKRSCDHSQKAYQSGTPQEPYQGLDQGTEFEQAIDRITAGTVAPLEPRPTINIYWAARLITNISRSANKRSS